MEKSGIHAEKINLEGVIKELMRDVQSLENKRNLDQDEIKHVVQTRQALEGQVAQLQQANMAVREDAMQQQSFLQQELDRLQVQVSECGWLTNEVFHPPLSGIILR